MQFSRSHKTAALGMDFVLLGKRNGAPGGLVDKWRESYKTCADQAGVLVVQIRKEKALVGMKGNQLL